jgi:hypothetical protein
MLPIKKPKMERVELLISQEKETALTLSLAEDLLKQDFNASNTVVVTVSIDYSSNVGQLLRHALSYNGEICDGFGIDVPYPDESWDEMYKHELEQLLSLYSYKLKGKKILLVEAGVIRGGNYTFLLNFLRDRGLQVDVFFLTLFENKSSIFKCNFVGEYYDNETQDLTFWWEEENNHWL